MRPVGGSLLDADELFSSLTEQTLVVVGREGRGNIDWVRLRWEGADERGQSLSDYWVNFYSKLTVAGVKSHYIYTA